VGGSRNAVVSLVAAALGAAAVLLVGRATGLFDRTTRTVVDAPLPPPPAATAPVVARALTGGAFSPARIFKTRAPGVVTVYAAFGASQDLGPQQAQGSGFVVSPRGYILTNAHVVTTAPDLPARAARAVYVEFGDGDRIKASIVGYDLFSDVGLLKVDPGAHALRPVPLGDSSRVVVGEPVAAIGSPFGNENTLTVGVVSGTRRSIDSLEPAYRIADAIQTDAAINHGNSGGPLFDARGEAIGINAQIRTESGANEGVGFAVPIDTAKRSMRQLVERGRVSYAYVGVTTDDLTPTLARHFGYRPLHGAVVACVTPGGPAAAAGLRAGTPTAPFNGASFVSGGDVVVGIDGRPVHGGEDLVRIVSETLEAGDIARFRVVRGRSSRVVKVRLAERPAKPPAAC
jgi:S1-C subfamily serine protease